MISAAKFAEAWPFLAVGAAGVGCLLLLLLVRLAKGDHIEPPDEGAPPP